MRNTNNQIHSTFFLQGFSERKAFDCYKLINGSVNAQLTLYLVSEPVSGVLNPHWSVQTGSSKSEPMSPSGGYNLTKGYIFFFYFFFTILRFFLLIINVKFKHNIGVTNKVGPNSCTLMHYYLKPNTLTL